MNLLVRPVSPVDPLPVATYNARRQTHRDEVKDYLYEQSELNKLTDKVFASLDETTADHIADAGGLGMTECSLAHVMQIMRTENGRLSYKQIGDISDTLKTPFNPESGMDDKAHAILRNNNAEVNDFNKILLFRRGLQCAVGDLYDESYRAYARKCREADPPRLETWPTLRAALIAASQELPAAATVGNAGFDNAAVKGPADERIDVLTAQLSALTTAVAKIAGKPAHAQTGTTLYCYTHGWNLSHTGKSTPTPVRQGTTSPSQTGRC
ncbi:hypothetical protein B484DRAFT_407211 [Ochromonadaceae sp. CCMP2298]|nr:hypothetical protein B484DRAFT_407211 [Ochromonadaceae sp. CCMP2298]